MGARSTGLLDRRGLNFDALTVLVGAVRAGTRGRPAANRTGAELILNTRLEANDVVKLVVNGVTGSGGKYTVQVAHVPEGSTTASTYGTLAVVTCAPGKQVIAFTGEQIREIARVAGSVTGDVRVAAVRATAGTAGDAPIGTNIIRLHEDR